MQAGDAYNTEEKGGRIRWVNERKKRSRRKNNIL